MVTPRSGYDLEYYLNRAGEKTPGGYYLNAAQQGEPPGRWFGKGAEALGFADGQLVERDPYLAAYQQTDPVTGEKLGRAPNGWKRFSQIFAAKLAAEPHATWERRLELEREAGQQARRSPIYTDLTVAHNKSISVLHASFREQARRAREWERRHGRSPNARDMQYLGLKANKVTRKGKEGEIDWEALTAGVGCHDRRAARRRRRAHLRLRRPAISPRWAWVL